MLAIFLWFWTQTLTAGAGELPHFIGSGSAYSSNGGFLYPVPEYAPFNGKVCFLQGGFYAVNLQMGMLPGAEAEGNITFELFSGTEPPVQVKALTKNHILLRWRANAGYTQQGNAIVVYVDANDCFRLSYTASATAYVNHEPYATKLTIYKVADKP